MTFLIATSFNKTLQRENVEVVEFTQEQIRDIVQNHINHLDYNGRQELVKQAGGAKAYQG